MYCNKDIHDELISMELVSCPFCYEQIQAPSTKNETCCQNVKIQSDNGMIVCVNWSQAEGYEAAKKYIYLIFTRVGVILSKSLFTIGVVMWKNRFMTYVARIKYKLPTIK